MKDVAQAAGVSITTVSNVINGNYSHVSPETVERIKAIIGELDYTPNLSARSLVKNNSRIIGVVNYQTSKAGAFIHDPFLGTLLDSIERTLTATGYYMMVGSVQSEAELLRLLRVWSMDAFIVTGSIDSENLEGLLAAGKPFVLVDSYLKTPNAMSVGLEDYRGGYIATRYLIDRGHRSIVFASPRPIPGGVIAERIRGYRQALEEAGLPFSAENIFHRDLNVTEGVRLGRELARRRDITAIVASADLLAASIISGLRECGAEVPRDFSIVGFDDLELCMLIHPRLTTIHQDPEIKGRLVAEMVVRTLRGKALINPNIVLPVNLVERESVRSL